MINTKCPMSKTRRSYQSEGGINDKCSGYVLLAMTFIIVAFVSVVYLLAYPLAKEGVDDADYYLKDRNCYRFRKAMFGEQVDCSGTKLKHTSSFFSSGCPTKISGGPHHCRCETTILARRYFGRFDRLRYDGHSSISIPPAFQYAPNTWWKGYRGKRYLHVLPSDDWGYNNNDYPHEGYSDRRVYKPFDQAYARVIIPSGCGGGVGYSCSSEKDLGPGTGCSIRNHFHAYVELKDYSDEREDHEIRLFAIGRLEDVSFGNSDIDHDYVSKVVTDDYVLRVFRQHTYRLYHNVAGALGQTKLLIQVCEKDALGNWGPWLTKETRVICAALGVSSGLGRRKSQTFRMNFYGS